jgi:hypothetical protein
MYKGGTECAAESASRHPDYVTRVIAKEPYWVTPFQLPRLFHMLVHCGKGPISSHFLGIT